MNLMKHLMIIHLIYYIVPNDLNYIKQEVLHKFFSYYDLTYEFNCEDENCFNEITFLLHYDECQINLYYIDTFINVNDYKNPIKKNF